MNSSLLPAAIRIFFCSSLHSDNLTLLTIGWSSHDDASFCRQCWRLITLLFLLGYLIYFLRLYPLHTSFLVKRCSFLCRWDSILSLCHGVCMCICCFVGLCNCLSVLQAEFISFDEILSKNFYVGMIWIFGLNLGECIRKKLCFLLMTLKAILMMWC